MKSMSFNGVGSCCGVWSCGDLVWSLFLYSVFSVSRGFVDSSCFFGEFFVI